MKKGDNQIPFDSEPLVLDLFERFFIFEFYVRYIRSWRRQDLLKILELKELIRNRFVELDVMSALSIGKFGFYYGPEVTYGTYIELHELIDWTLDSIQFSDCRLDYLCSDFCNMNLPKTLVDQLFTPFKELNDTIEPSLKSLCYRFSDLTTPNDIYFVFKWWSEHTKTYIRDKRKLVGKFGTTFIEVDDSGDTFYGISDFNFNAPRLISYIKNNYDIYKSDHHEISIDGEHLSNSIVLNIKFDADAQNLEAILNEFKSHFFGAQGLWYFDQLQSGYEPDFKLSSSKSITDSAVTPSTQSYTVLPKYTTISKYLIGLMCYDLHKQEGEKKLSLKDAAEDIEIKIARIKPHKANIITQYYYVVQESIDTIYEIIRKKYPDKLF